uniref:Uncharacterized protein n=1 Tax=Oryza glumipatula TaxID=40148 RepID=A0A0E0BNG1_9ORYZ
MVKAISEAADSRLITNTNLLHWLMRLHAAAQEAKDVLDEFEVDGSNIARKRKASDLILSSRSLKNLVIADESLKRIKIPSIIFKISRNGKFFSKLSLKNLVIPDESLTRLEHVVKTLTQLCATSATFIELIKMDDSKTNQLHKAAKASSHLPVDVPVFGRDEVKEFILNVIIGSPSHDHTESSIGTGKVRAARHNILVLPIVGMSGVGKTTLAQVIYNHARVKQHFEHRAWVYVSEDFTIKRTLQEILHSFQGHGGAIFNGDESMEATITKLRIKISGGCKFFLVLDNMWEEMCQEWSVLLTALSDEAPLPWESFWPLFQYHTFGGVEVPQQDDNRNMLLIAQGIAKKLDGLPLAAKVIGNLLRCRFSWDNWRRVAESDWWNLEEALQGILPYLRVSYQHLSPKQRQCLAYCSIFPRNYLFDKDRVVQMWLAHDFIQWNEIADVMRPDDVGRQLFDELVERSFFQPTFVSNKYVMPDLVDLHHLSYVKAPGKVWPKDARPLRKLRFLDLSFTKITKLKDLPTNLRVLHLRGYDADRVPQSITKLTNLRHLYVDGSALSKIQSIGQQTELQELESFIARKGQGFMIRELKNMREFTGRLCIRGIENIRSKDEAMEARLMDKKHVGALVIEGKRVPKFALEGLQPHTNIQELTIKFFQEQDFPDWVCPDNLVNLLQVNLESYHFLSTIPPLGHLPLLKLLTLRKLPSVKHVNGTSFGGFPSLEEFELHSMEKWEEWTEPDAAAHAYGSSLFLGHLRKLHLAYCPSLKRFPHLPCLSALKELKISKPGSWILALPACSQVLSSLITLAVEYCNHNVVMSAQQFKSLENIKLIKSEGLRLADGFQYFSKLRSARVEGRPQLLSAITTCVSVGFGQDCCVAHDEKQQQEASLLTHLRADDSLMYGDYFRTVGKLPSLRNLTICNESNGTNFSVKQELWFQQQNSLEHLCIQGFHALQRLPSFLVTMLSIKILELHGLHGLQSIPDNALPLTLQEFNINNCTSCLSTRVSKDGADWPYVAHVPYIRVNGTTVQNL